MWWAKRLSGQVEVLLGSIQLTVNVRAISKLSNWWVVEFERSNLVNTKICCDMIFDGRNIRRNFSELQRYHASRGTTVTARASIP